MFHVLGAFHVHVDGTQLPVTAPKLQAVLATLVLSAGRPVSVDRLTDHVWDGVPPAAARTALQAYIYRLRKILLALPTVQLSGNGNSYVLELGTEEVDLHQFRSRVGQAREHARSALAEQAAAKFRSALELWHGPALDGVPGELLQQEAQFLEEEHLAAYEELIDLELTLGRHAALLPELARHAATNPLREQASAQLMLALYRSGRQAEALELYLKVRRRLRRELGIEPGTQLRQLQAVILGQK